MSKNIMIKNQEKCQKMFKNQKKSQKQKNFEI